MLFALYAYIILFSCFISSSITTIISGIFYVSNQCLRGAMQSFENVAKTFKLRAYPLLHSGFGIHEIDKVEEWDQNR